MLWKDTGNVAQKCHCGRNCLLKQNWKARRPRGLEGSPLAPASWAWHAWCHHRCARIRALSLRIGQKSSFRSTNHASAAHTQPVVLGAVGIGRLMLANPEPVGAALARPTHPHSSLPSRCSRAELSGVSAVSVLCSCSWVRPSERLPSAGRPHVSGRTCRLACRSRAYALIHVMGTNGITGAVVWG